MRMEGNPGNPVKSRLPEDPGPQLKSEAIRRRPHSLSYMIITLIQKMLGFSYITLKLT